MGLDMYLAAQMYLSDTDLFGADRQEKYGKVVEAVGATSFVGGSFPSANVSVSVAYWRKANAIHQWFVNNVQGGEDNCAEYYVSREKLAELLDVCREVKASPEMADELLPTASGFFFGGTEYDEWYMDSIDLTIEQVESAIKNVPNDWDLYYRSSW